MARERGRPAARAASSRAAADVPATRSLYDCPQWYDIVHEAGTADEVTRLEHINREFGTGGRDWLEPACGTGRFLRVLARRGYRAVGYDRSEVMLRYARDRLLARRLRAEVVRGDMAAFVRPRRFDFAYNLINTFRHLHDDSLALAHLGCIVRSLRRGGVYVLGLDLVDYDDPQPGEEVWTARRGLCQVRHVMLSIPPDRRTRRERIINHLIVDRPCGRESFASHYDLRAYSLGQWLDLLEASGLECIASFDFAWQPIVLTGYTRDVNLVLKSRAGRRGPRRIVSESRAKQ